MTTAESSFARCGIATRFLVLLSLFFFVVGSGAIYVGSTDSESLREQRRTEMLKAKGLETSEFRDCLRAATRADDGAQVKLCYARHGPDMDCVQTLQDGVNSAKQLVDRALALIFIPIFLLLALFIVRWAITGLWRRSTSVKIEPKQDTNSA
jgi:hypothetical protein